MSQVFQRLSEMIQTYGVGVYFGVAGLIIFYIIGFISVWLAIGMLIYSLFSKNWAVWRKWKYMGYLALLGMALLILGIIIRAITAGVTGS